MNLVAWREVCNFKIAVSHRVGDRAAQRQLLTLLSRQNHFYDDLRPSPRDHGTRHIGSDIKSNFAWRFGSVFPAVHGNCRFDVFADQNSRGEPICGHVTIPNLSVGYFKCMAFWKYFEGTHDDRSPIPVHNSNHDVDAPLDVLNCVNGWKSVAEQKLRLPLLLFVLTIKEDNGYRGGGRGCPAAECANPLSRTVSQFGLLLSGAIVQPIRPKSVNDNRRNSDGRENHGHAPAQIVVLVPTHDRMRSTSLAILARAA